MFTVDLVRFRNFIFYWFGSVWGLARHAWHGSVRQMASETGIRGKGRFNQRVAARFQALPLLGICPRIHLVACNVPVYDILLPVVAGSMTHQDNRMKMPIRLVVTFKASAAGVYRCFIDV